MEAETYLFKPGDSFSHIYLVTDGVFQISFTFQDKNIQKNLIEYQLRKLTNKQTKNMRYRNLNSVLNQNPVYQIKKEMLEQALKSEYGCFKKNPEVVPVLHKGKIHSNI